MKRTVRLAAAVWILGLGACTAIERSTIPEARVTDAAWEAHEPGSLVTVDHSAWDRFLATYRILDADGVAKIRYAEVTQADRAALDAYLDTLSRTDTAALDRPEQLAFWINLYNAKTVALILDAYPVESIRSVRGGVFGTGPWSDKLLTVGGRPLSLNDIEHAIARPIWRDPRLHYAFNCAALGCPNLAEEAFTGANLERLFESGARAYINDPRGFKVASGGWLTASKIYVWFEEDFGAGSADVLDHARQYASPDLAAQLEGRTRIESYAYDWGLNEAAPPAGG